MEFLNELVAVFSSIEPSAIFFDWSLIWSWDLWC